MIRWKNTDRLGEETVKAEEDRRRQEKEAILEMAGEAPEEDDRSDRDE